MKKITLSNEYLSAFTMQLSLLIHAGINLADGIHLLAEDEGSESVKQLLVTLGEKMDDGMQLSEAMAQTGVFPEYMVHMARTGEQTGRTEEAFRSMAEHYESQRQLSDRIKSAILYPVVLLILMLIIIGILLVRVLPIFHTVYQQLGGSLTGVAAGLLGVGEGLKASLPIIGILMGVIILFGFIMMFSNGMRAKVVKQYKKFFGSKGISRKIGTARFASAMSMGMMSGLPMEEALKMAMSFYEESPKVKAIYEDCLNRLHSGEPLADALRQSGVFASLYCRMLAVGIRSGAGDVVMEEIAERLQEDAQSAIEDTVAKIEPTIVIVTSIMVGIILLAVMLPLMNIMVTIGV